MNRTQRSVAGFLSALVLTCPLAAGRGAAQTAATTAPIRPTPTTTVMPITEEVVYESGRPGWGMSNFGGGQGPFWADAEYLLWWMRGPTLPPLVTESPVGTPLEQSGVLGTPGVSVLFGGDSVNEDPRSGFRIMAGVWLDDCHTCGLDFEYLLLEAKATHFLDGSDGSRQISRPFVNAATGAQDSELVSFPGLLAGSVGVNATTGGLQGLGGHVRCNCINDCGRRVDWLVGYRHLRFTDSLDVTENLTSIGGIVPLGTNFIVRDSFSTENEFNGLDLGVVGEWRFNRWVVGATGRLGVGVISRTVQIDGSTTFTVPGDPAVTLPGGLLALPSNIGTYRSNDWSIVPEVKLTLGYQVTNGIRAYIGYNFLLMTEVAYAGEQIDLVVNTDLLPQLGVAPTPPLRSDRPTFLGNQATFWAQGIDFGVRMDF